jgi:hypothetical protein
MSEFSEIILSNIHTCFAKNLNIADLENETLSLSEIRFKLNDNKLIPLNRNESQDASRINAFLKLLNLCNLSDVNCEFILNMYEGIYSDVNASRFCYAAKPNSNHVLIPDSHNFNTYNHVLNIAKHDIDFNLKLKSAVFAGSDTGRRRKDGWTMRCLLSFLYKDSKLINSKITFPDQDFYKRFSEEKNAIVGNPISIDEQLKHQVILNVNGNSTSWERLVWAMSSNSLCVFVKPFDGEQMYSWYYPIIESLGICPMVEVNKLEEFLKNNNFENSFWKDKNNQQKEFAKIISHPDFQSKFLTQVFIKYNEEYNS